MVFKFRCRQKVVADFRAAQIFVTYFAPTQVDEKVVDVAAVLQSWSKDIQDEIAHVLKMRYCPRLTFFNDETTEKILKIEKLLSDISNDPKLAEEFDEDVD